MGVEISVIVTAYNVERYIERAIRSALGQEGVNLEVIVIDDGSGDASWSIISAMADPRIKPLRLGKNSGPGAARNAGIALSEGKWIAVLDGDDAFAPGRLKRCMSLAIAQKADIVVDNLEIRREADGKAFPMFNPEYFSRLSRIDLATFIRETIPGSGSYRLGYLKPLFSADFLRRHALSYHPGLRIGEDYLLLAEALASGGTCVVEPAPGYLYTVRMGSISHRLPLAAIAGIMEGDELLASRYAFPPEALRAQEARTRSLKKEYAFTLLVDAIKQKDLAGIARAAALRPGCLWLLWRPLWARIQRIVT